MLLLPHSGVEPLLPLHQLHLEKENPLHCWHCELGGPFQWSDRTTPVQDVGAKASRGRGPCQLSPTHLRRARRVGLL